MKMDGNRLDSVDAVPDGFGYAGLASSIVTASSAFLPSKVTGDFFRKLQVRLLLRSTDSMR